MKRPICTLAILTLLLSNLTLAQSTKQAGTKKGKQASANLQPAKKEPLPEGVPQTTGGSAAKVAPAGLLPVVVGEGTPGTITKWTGNA